MRRLDEVARWRSHPAGTETGRFDYGWRRRNTISRWSGRSPRRPKCERSERPYPVSAPAEVW